ncbi:MAG: hypothetical protein MJZ34_01745 [Paludibacteraceae bacterium]|nr:hypothetical protein [Paludibacteraceae bacterium]
MIDLKTGRFVINEEKGWFIEPGMKKEDLKNSKLYLNGPLSENYKLHPEWRGAYFNHIDINGYDMNVDVEVNRFNYVDCINMYLYDAHEPDLSKEEAYRFKSLHDKFLSEQIGNQLKSKGEIWLDYEWGSISSEISLMHFTTVEIVIRYNLHPFLVADGIIKPVTAEEARQNFLNSL